MIPKMALLLLMAASCSAQTTLYKVTIGKPVNANLPDCPENYTYDQACVLLHPSEDNNGESAIQFPGNAGSISFGELDGVVQYLEGFYHVDYKDQLARQLTNKFGQAEITREKWENAYHEFIELQYTWHRKDATIVLFRYGNDNCKVLVWTPKWKRYKAKLGQRVDGSAAEKSQF